MKGLNKLLKISVIVSLSIFFMCAAYSFADQVQEEGAADLVAHITVIQGRLERFDPDAKAWVIMVPDAPAGIDDRLYTSVGTRVEILVPNDTLLRLGEKTEAGFVSLKENLTQIELFSGTARLCNNSRQADIIAATPFGRIEVPPGASVDLYADDKSVEIISLDGSVYFTSDSSDVSREIFAGSASLLAYSDRIVPSNGSVKTDWNVWNQGRDTFWAERMRSPGESRAYLPESLRDEAYVLDTCGSWRQVYYDGAYYNFWRPEYVGFGWSPFTVGIWMDWRGDRVWIPREPFGYVTHHYGNWIYTMGTWYWAPPVSYAMISAGFPLLDIGFGWYPGRVGWIGAGIQSSWIPLAPFESYYSHYPWGRRTIVIAKGTYHRYASSHQFKYRRHTVVGRHDQFYRSRIGSHISNWPAVNRSDVRTSLVRKREDRTEKRSFPARREKITENRPQRESERETRPRRDRMENSGSRIKRDRDGDAQVKTGNDIRPSWRDGNRRPKVRADNGAVSASPGKSRRYNDDASKQRGDRMTKQDWSRQTEGFLRTDGAQDRPRLTGNDRNESRTRSGGYRPR